MKYLQLAALTLAILLTAAPRGEAVDIRLQSGGILRVDAVTPAILHVRLSADGKFGQSLMERYGIVRSDWPKAGYQASSADGQTTLSTEQATLTVRHADGAMTLGDLQGRALIEEIRPLGTRLSPDEQAAYRKRQADLADYFRYRRGPAKGDEAKLKPSVVEHFSTDPAAKQFGATLSLKAGERFYGLGAASSKRLQLRGFAYRNFPEYRGAGGYDDTAPWEQTDQPSPLVLGSGGWGLFINTSWLHYVDVGRYQPDKLFFWGPGGELDFYLLVGRGLPEQLDLYTQITGRPIVLPLWGYGLMNICPTDSNQFEVLAEAQRWRREKIPCDMIALEPGWMEKIYDYSHEKEWSRTRFNSTWQPKEWNFQGALRRMDYKLFLWLCCNDDLTQEEERQIAIRAGRPHDVPERPDAWFNHLRKFIAFGVEGFKLDPSRIVEPQPERKYFNGRSDLEMHNLNQVLLHKQMWLGFVGKEGHAAQRHMHHYCGGYAGVQRWGATTAGDNADVKGLCWVLSQGLSGHMNTTFDMFPVETAEQSQWRKGTEIHVNFLLPWVELNNWQTALEPWYLGEDREAMFKDYARLRYRLLPYIYSLAHEGARSGMPIARAMPLAFPDDRHCDNLTRQWMLGPWLLTSGYTDEIYLPAGCWIDYWTGRLHQGPKQFKPAVPRNRGGPLLVRGGAILVTGPEAQYVGQRPCDRLGLEVWPEGRSRFTLTEDDGQTYRYLDGELATTTIASQLYASHAVLTIPPRHGRYQGMPRQRSFDLRWHIERPAELTLNGRVLPEGPQGWTYDAAGNAACLVIWEDPERKVAAVVEGRW